MVRFLLILFFGFYALVSSLAQGGRLHCLLLVDEYSDIAPACLADKQKMEAEAHYIARSTGLQLNLQTLSFEADSLREQLHDLQVGKEDVVLFYFTGHGYRYEDQKSCGDFPFLYISRTGRPVEASGLCFSELGDLLRRKGGRLTIALADCCNNVIPMEEPVAMSIRGFSSMYTRLFLESEGYILASSSLPGQFSYATDTGGYFTNAFLQSLKEMERQPPAQEMKTWETLIAKTRVKTILDSRSKQRPFFEYSIRPWVKETRLATMMTDGSH